MLFRDLLIGVTSFFRDEQTFDLLKRTVVPRLFEGKNADDTIRIWVPGCATGEEAYSLADLDARTARCDRGQCARGADICNRH